MGPHGSGDGRSPQRPRGGVWWHPPQPPNWVKAEERRRQATRALNQFVSGGLAPQIGAPRSGDGRSPQRPQGGALWHPPQPPNWVKAEERRRQATRALNQFVSGGLAPQMGPHEVGTE